MKHCRNNKQMSSFKLLARVATIKGVKNDKYLVTVVERK